MPYPSHSGREDDPSEHLACVHPPMSIGCSVQGEDVVHDGVQVAARGGGELLRPYRIPRLYWDGVEAERRERAGLLERTHTHEAHAEVRGRQAGDHPGN